MGDWVQTVASREPWLVGTAAPGIVIDEIAAVDKIARDSINDADTYSKEFKDLIANTVLPDIHVLVDDVNASLTDIWAILSQYLPVKPTGMDFPTLADVAEPQFLDMPDISIPSETIPIPEVNYNYSETPYTSTLADRMKAKMFADLASGIPVDIETAAYERAKERLRAKYQQDMISLSERNAGFDQPPGALVAAMSELSDNFNQALLDLDRDAIKAQHDYKLAVLQQANSFEQVQTGHFDQTQGRLLQAAEKEATVPLESAKLKVEVYRTKVGAAVDSGRLKVEAVSAVNKYRMDVFEAKMKKTTFDLQTFISKIEAKLKMYLGDTDVFKGLADGLKAVVSGEAQMFDAEVKYVVGKAEVQEKDKEIIYNALLNRLTQAVDTVKAKFSVAAQIAASALAALHVGANIQHGVSDSTSIGWSYGESRGNTLTESHQTSETATTQT